jgi:hypothetical protein
VGYSRSYYELANKKNSEVDIETNLLCFKRTLKPRSFESNENAAEMIDVFPAQPQFYYYAGLGCNQLTQFKKHRNIGNGIGLFG